MMFEVNIFKIVLDFTKNLVENIKGFCVPLTEKVGKIFLVIPSQFIL